MGGISIDEVVWVELKAGTNVSCPRCGNVMIILPFHTEDVIAFCANCKQYWKGLGRWKNY